MKTKTTMPDLEQNLLLTEKMVKKRFIVTMSNRILLLMWMVIASISCLINFRTLTEDWLQIIIFSLFAIYLCGYVVTSWIANGTIKESYHYSLKAAKEGYWVVGLECLISRKFFRYSKQRHDPRILAFISLCCKKNKLELFAEKFSDLSELHGGSPVN